MGIGRTVSALVYTAASLAFYFLCLSTTTVCPFSSPHCHRICECNAHPLHNQCVLAPTLLALALRCRAIQRR
ncbi:hypothetical protein C8R45DRAFT_1030521 [Mycena sanguinolenta]|nr:hypothetical protein C8R45DRAFT_1030521 [Mycena sanguinolenta]